MSQNNLKKNLQDLFYVKMSLDEERECLKRKDKDSIKKLLQHHWPLIISVAKQLSYKNTIMPDLIQEGIIGFLDAVKSYQPAYANRLSSFAVYYIKGAMLNFIVRNYSSITLPNYETYKRLKTQNKLLLPVVFPLETIKSITNIEKSFINNSLTYEQIVVLRKATKALSARDRDILLRRCSGPHKVSLKDLAHRHNLSIERVRQIELKSKNFLREKIRSVRATIPRPSA